jgi:exopolyphosphatase/guanosine-5'-triphosphate,3'-diphosphate pyrophosphatase
VATAAVRRARNGAELAGVLARECDVELRVLSEADEARLAFLGACAALDAGGQTPPADEPLGVVDVGGGSSELVLGRFPDGIDWFRSLPLGSGIVADACFTGDPPTSTEVGEAYAQAAKALEGVEVPRPARAIAVGGSAASLCRLAGARLDAAAFRTALDVLLGAPAEQVAARFDLAADRVRLLPGGLVILETVQRCFGVPLELVGGGLREGVLLEAARH